MSIMALAIFGGVFAVLVGLHFVADWPFQSQKEAMAKAKDWRVRAWHCVKYTVAFWPLFLLVDFHGWKAGLATFILFFSHFLIDTYWPVMMWAKHFRKVPHFADVDRNAIKQEFTAFGTPIFTMTKEQYEQLRNNSSGFVTGSVQVAPMMGATPHTWSDKKLDKVTYASDEEAFKASWSAGVNGLLYITMDQLFHILFLAPVAYLMMQ